MLYIYLSWFFCCFLISSSSPPSLIYLVTFYGLMSPAFLGVYPWSPPIWSGIDSWVRHSKNMIFPVFSMNFLIGYVLNSPLMSKFIYYRIYWLNFHTFCQIFSSKNRCLEITQGVFLRLCPEICINILEIKRCSTTFLASLLLHGGEKRWLCEFTW
jgi:hypothetical protein